MDPFRILWVGLPHLVYFGLLKPYRTWRNRGMWRNLKTPLVPRVQRYRVNTANFLSCGALSLIAMFALWRFSSRTPMPTDIFVLGRTAARPADVWFGLFPAEWPGLSSLLFGAIAYAIMIAIDLAYSRRCFDRGEPHMYYASPQTREERTAWIGHSAAAGVTEELTWRGVQPEMIAQLTGSLWLAVILCAATFGLGHITQGRPFVAIATLFALIFHALTWLTGGLYVAMIVHVAVNVTVGLRAGTWVKAT